MDLTLVRQRYTIRLAELEEFERRWAANSPRVLEQLKKRDPVPSTDFLTARHDAENLIRDALDVGVITASMTPEADIEVIGKDLSDMLARVKSDLQICDKLVSAATDFKEKRDGDLTIRITLLNRGDTDGLVQTVGKLALEGLPDVPLHIDPNSMRKVERRSAIEATFRPSWQLMPSAGAQEVSNIIKRGEKLRGTVHLKGYRGDDFSGAVDVDAAPAQ